MNRAEEIKAMADMMCWNAHVHGWRSSEPANIIPHAGERARLHAAIDKALAGCQVPPEGWICTRPGGHEGPCAAWPVLTKYPSLPRRILAWLRGWRIGS